MFLFNLRRTGRAGNKGFAYTFITPDQVKYTGDIMLALELSSQPVPEDLKAMWDAYVKEMEAVYCFFCNEKHKKEF